MRGGRKQQRKTLRMESGKSAGRLLMRYEVRRRSEGDEVWYEVV